MVLLLTAHEAVSQVTPTYFLENHDTIWVYNCRGDNFLIKNRDIHVEYIPIDYYFVVETFGAPFTVHVNVTQSTSGDGATVSLWNDNDSTGTLLYSSSAMNQFQDVYVPSGRLFGRLHRTDVVAMGLEFQLSWNGNAPFTSPCHRDIVNLRDTNLMHTSAALQWDDTPGSFLVSYDGVDHITHVNDYFLQDLTPDSDYTVNVISLSDTAIPCCARTIHFRTGCIPHIGCPDFTDLESESVRGYYGTFDNPYQSVGFISNCDEPVDCRHTIHTDTTETDPRTGDLLRTVRPGTSASVRLGNWNNGKEAEAIEYFLYIDTNIYALLLLHYAVVLQNPNHASSQQPHFRMEVLDNDNNVIDPVCGVADFAASSSLGWNEYSYGSESVVWKDWTTIGFDMTPYHGRVVKVRFTTRDCNGGEHFGYAYFDVSCSLNSASTEYCGETDTNSLTAPDGFDYLWYYDINNPVSTDQTVYFTNNDALLHCRLIYKDNPSCYVTLNTYAGTRWPLAVIDTLQTESLGCDGYRVYFLNRSVVTNDNGDTVDWHCESARWYFGDAYISFDYTPQHVYRDSGDYTVTLVAGIANNSCRDTTQYTIHIPDFYVPALKDTFACDTFWIDGTSYTRDTLGPSYRVHHPGGCDTLYTLNLHVLPSTSFELPTDTFCYSATYSWRDMTAGDAHITDTAHYRLVDHFPAANGCDSMLVLNLVQLPPARLSVNSQADCSNKKYYVTVSSEFPYLHWTSEPHDTCLDGHESDSSLLVIPSIQTTYTVTTDSRDTTYCPTSRDITLSPAGFPTAALMVSPKMLTYDQMEFRAKDISRYPSRWWGLRFFPGSDDTLRLHETSANLHYRLEDPNLDSVKVILAVSNDICHDTTHLTLPFIKVAIWAPNVFTPSESTNNRFAPVTTGIPEAELFIYDRAGRRIFNTKDLVEGWDGTHDGTPCPQGTYVWFLRYRTADYPDTWQTTSGSVTLLR